MSRFILLLSVGLAGYLIYHMYIKRLKKIGKPEMTKIAIIIAGVFFVLMALTGHAHIVFAFIGAIMASAFRYLPLIMRHFPLLQKMFRQYKNGSPAGAQQSRVKTVSLLMLLDHESGHIDGEITLGSFKGQHLSELSIEQLKQYYQYCQTNDPEAIRLLQAYIQRERADQWQDAPNDQSTVQNTADFSNDEAWDILGLKPGASREDIITAHRRLMSRMHPDKGGSNYIAAKINQAKKILLAKI